MRKRKIAGRTIALLLSACMLIGAVSPVYAVGEGEPIVGAADSEESDVIVEDVATLGETIGLDNEQSSGVSDTAITQVCMGDTNCAAIMGDGSLWSWGGNGLTMDGVLGNKTYTPEKILDEVVQVSVQDGTWAVIKKDKSLWLWGDNGHGQVGDGTTETRTMPVKIMDGVIQVSEGYGYSAAVKEDRSLWLWGCNDGDTLGDGMSNNCLEPKKIIEESVAQVSVNYLLSAALTVDGTLYYWGLEAKNDNGGCYSVPTKVMEEMSSVSLGWLHSVAIKKDGTLWYFGGSGGGQRSSKVWIKLLR